VTPGMSIGDLLMWTPAWFGVVYVLAFGLTFGLAFAFLNWGRLLGCYMLRVVSHGRVGCSGWRAI
jgi:hypothetical protein